MRKKLLNEIKKKFFTRFLFWVIGITILILGDEVIKEGYVFKIEDVTNPSSHEFLIIVMWGVLITSYCIKILRRKKSQ